MTEESIKTIQDFFNENLDSIDKTPNLSVDESGINISSSSSIIFGFKKPLNSLELFSKKEMKSAYNSGFAKGFFVGILALTAVAYVFALII